MNNETPDPSELPREPDEFPAEFWNLVQPPAVSDSKWAAVEAAIARRCLVPTTLPIRRWIGLGLGAMIAATVVVVVYAWQMTDEPTREIAKPVPKVNPEVAPEPRDLEDPLREYAVLPMARPGEVMIQSVRGGVSPFVVGPSQPVPEELTLAGTQDIRVETVRPAGNTGRMPDSKTIADTGGVPMIYASAPR